jgi:carbon monoxide dehydrogenase subunit G
MELEHSFTVPVPEERAWDVLLDVERVAPCMPGATLQSVDGDEIHGAIKVKVGPITMTYQGTARFTERDPAGHVITLEASGKETRGAGTASAKVRSMLEGKGGETHVVVHTTLNVTGKPAQFGRGVMSEVGGKLIGIFAGNLASMLAAEGSDDSEEGDTAGNTVAAGPDEDLPIDVLNLPVRAWSSLRHDGIQTLGDLVRRNEEQLLAIGNIGPASVAEIRSKLADRGLFLADSTAAGVPTTAAGVPTTSGGVPTTAGGAPVPPARPGADDTAAPVASSAAASTDLAAEKAAANGSARPAQTPREPVGWQPQDDAIDLLGVAGLPVLKRAVPAAAGLLVLILVVFGLRRRRTRRG